MLRVVPLLDQHDESGRSTLTHALCTAVIGEDTPEDLVDAAVEAIAHLNPGYDMVDTMHKLVFQFSSLLATREPGSFEKKCSEYRLSIVLSECLKHVSLGTEVGSEVEASLLSIISSETSETRERAVQGLGRLCLLSEARAQRFLPILLNICVASSSEVISVRGVAVQALVDMMMMHESCAAMLRDEDSSTLTQLPAAQEWSLAVNEESGPSSTVFRLLKWLIQEGGPIACLAAESTSKLILNQRLGQCLVLS